MGMRAVLYYRWNRALATILWSFFAGLAGEAAGAESKPPFDFAHRVVPILKRHCVECHGAHRHEGDFSLNTRESTLEGRAIVPGDSAASHLIELLTSDDKDERMPKDKPPLSLQEIKTLREWVDAKLPWEPGFTFAEKTYEPPLRPRRPELPPAVDGRDNPVDRILDAYLSQHNVARPEALSDAAFLRRVYLDIVGLLPNADQLHEFLANNDPNKRAQAVEQLLANNQSYAEHWLSFWNDLLRNDYQGTGYIDGGRKQISAWLYRSLLENKPFDEFTRELIAPTAESEGFINGIKWRGNVNASQKQEVQFAQNVGQVFLGLNMKCASCHDSFIDRWKLSETYGLAAIYADEPLEINRCDKPTGTMAKAAWLFPELGQIDPAAQKAERLKQLAKLMTDPQNGRLTRTIVNRIWHRLMGRGIVHPVDAMQTEPWSADLLDFLAVDLADRGYDLKSTIRLIMASNAYQSQAVALEAQPSGQDFVYGGPIAKRMTAEEFIDALWQLTSTGPKKPHKNVEAFLAVDQTKDRKSYRASLVASDLLMRSLGRPNREQVVSDRPAMLTTLQALDLSNSELLATTLSRGASHVLKRFETYDGSELITWLYESALARTPSDAERSLAGELLGSAPTKQGVEDLLWVVVMLPEFQIIR
jgi:Protein of unknown function (DUF1549)/Protein of unknown function (DUF1553)/Planctomycete cytochrome C